MDPEHLNEVSFFTHKLPVKLIIDYLFQFCKCSVLIIGIQPKDIAVGCDVSKEVTIAVKQLGQTVAKILSEKSRSI
jgi:hydrogenase 3 maturation protease